MSGNDGKNGMADEGAGEFERRVSALLVDSVDVLDGRTRSALTRARHAALAQAPARGERWRGWAPAGALAMALLVVVFYAGQRTGNGPAAAPTAVNAVDDLALVSDADAFDLSADGDLDLDSDFYEWAAAGGTPGNGLGS
jgi:hypothetical protein